MKLRFIANTQNAEDFFRKYSDVTDKKIKSLEVVSEKPYTVDVVPKLDGAHRKALESLLSHPNTRNAVIGDFTNNYAEEMRSEGLDVHEYEIEVLHK